MTRPLRTAAIVMLSALAGAPVGCVALAVGAAAGIGVYAYVDGVLKDTEEAPLASSYDATVEAMKDLEFRIKEQSKDALKARVVAEEADKTEVKVDMEASGEKITNFRIRVGVFGDEAKSRLIMDKIKKHL
jgi:hypothetical protein